MNNIFISTLTMGTLGFIISLTGLLTGMLLSSFVKRRGKRFKGTLLGFVGGLMLAIVCFDLLPESFEVGSVYIGIIGITFGLIISVLLDSELEHNHEHTSSRINHRYFKAAMLMAIGIGIHNIPGGIAFGSLFCSNSTKGFHLALALVIHGIPEGLTLGILLREYKSNTAMLLAFSMITSLPMGLGSVLGTLLGTLSPLVICFSLAIAGGMILYIIYRETLPSSMEIWKGKLSTVGNVLGMIAGILMISFLGK
ncbi:ZIP family zinc transporter [Clostridium punense]|uniref:ZIP family zinc transporter n=1 Tax=Clostridium punense TaxID=1054297 RepID=A0ABS4K533_9CLOT|nr:MULTISPECIES: ZIP family metal transporter [Clostridium]EQB86138.1 hypothetical protein M918_15595 [Clostridium sp. BL8]MBP2022878.1 ZIP family zinc transporter [Clostridium punense]